MNSAALRQATAFTAAAPRADSRALRAAAAPGVPRYLQPAAADMEGRVDPTVDHADDEGPGGVTPPTAEPQQVAPSPQPNDATATVPAHVRAASTRTGMPDRIPPRVDTPAAVTVAGWHIPMVDVILSVDGGGGGNGSATVNGAASAGVRDSGTVQLRGVDQTDAGKAGKLQLVARFAGNEVARSAGFSVSSVPQNWSTSLVSSITEPDAVGMVALNSWESDSGDVADLDQVKRMEQIEVITATGCFAGGHQGTSSWRDATLGSIQDNHRSSPRSALRALGDRVTNQVFIFKCDRVAVTDITAKNSGLRITRAVTADGAGGFNFDISKVGMAVTANGFTSAAASGNATAPTQTV